MPCFAALIALAAPRLLIVLLWVFTSWFRGVFHSAIWLILGFFFLPTTVLWYSAVHNWFNGQWTFWPLVGLVVAVLVDLGPMKRKRAQRT